MPEQKLMHVREIRSAVGSAALMADRYLLGRAPWYRPRKWLADKLAEAYHRGGADMARRILTGHRANAGHQRPAESGALNGLVGKSGGEQ